MPWYAPALEVKVDKRAFARVDKRLSKYMGRPLQQRAQRVYLEGARLMVTPTRRHVTRAGLVKSGTFRRSIKARSPRLRPGEMAVSSVGPTDPKRHLLIRGHRIVTRGGHDTGRRTRAFPVVDEAFADVGPQITDFIASRVLAVTGESFSSF